MYSDLFRDEAASEKLGEIKRITGSREEPPGYEEYLSQYRTALVREDLRITVEITYDQAGDEGVTEYYIELDRDDEGLNIADKTTISVNGGVFAHFYTDGENAVSFNKAESLDTLKHTHRAVFGPVPGIND